MNELEIINKHPELRKGFSWIIKNSTSNLLPYHNFNHLLVVVRYVYQASQYYNLPEKDEKELLMAALFHDVNHSGGSETDEVNIQRAKFAVSHVIDNYDIDIDKDGVCGIISATQYPYVIGVEELNLKQLIIRDADLMQVFEYNWIQQNMMGLSQELKIPLGDMISGQKDFLNGVEFNTDWGLFWKEQRWGDVKDKLSILEDLYNVEI